MTKGQSNGAWETNDILFDPLSMSPSTSSKTYDYEPSGNPDIPSGNVKNAGYWDRGIGAGRAGGGRIGNGAGRHFRTSKLFRNSGMRREEEDESHYLPEYNSGITRVLSIMQIISGVVIILIGIIAYISKATSETLIPAMDIGCAFVLYITGGVLGMCTKCRAKRIVAAFILLSSCSFVASIILGAIHSLASFRTQYICAYLHCGNTAQESSKQVMDGIIGILSLIEAVFALASLSIGVHGFCKYRDRK